MNTQFTIENSIDLLEGDFYTDIIEKEAFTILVSCFKYQEYNYIIPKRVFDEKIIRKVKSIIGKYSDAGYLFSYYIPEALITYFSDFIKIEGLNLLYPDLYIYLNTKPTDLQNTIHENIVQISKENLDKFTESANICFPDWVSVADFTKWCLDTKSVELWGIEKDNKIISFGGIMSKTGSNFVLLMHDGTLPEYRRQGFHDLIIRERIIKVLAKNKDAIFYANVEPNSTSHLGFKKLGFQDGPIFYAYAK